MPGPEHPSVRATIELLARANVEMGCNYLLLPQRQKDLLDISIHLFSLRAQRPSWIDHNTRISEDPARQRELIFLPLPEAIVHRRVEHAIAQSEYGLGIDP